MPSTVTPSEEPRSDAFGPVFSVTDRGDDIVMTTDDPTGSGLPRRTLAGCLALFAVVAVLFLFLGPALATGVWATVGWLLTGVLAALVSVRLHHSILAPMDRRHGRRSTATATARVPVLLGIGAGTLAGATGTLLTARTAGPAEWDVAVGVFLFLVIPGAATLIAAPVTAVRAWRGVRYAIRQQRVVHRLRELDRRLPGVLVAMEFQEDWSHAGNPLFTAKISVGVDAGATVFGCQVMTDRTRVPLPGNRVVVRYDPAAPLDRAALVELDPTVAPRFDPDSRRYRRPD